MFKPGTSFLYFGLQSRVAHPGLILAQIFLFASSSFASVSFPGERSLRGLLLLLEVVNDVTKNETVSRCCFFVSSPFCNNIVLIPIFVSNAWRAAGLHKKIITLERTPICTRRTAIKHQLFTLENFDNNHDVERPFCLLR